MSRPSENNAIAPTSSAVGPSLDPGILPRLRAHDPAAYDELVRCTAGKLLAVALRFVRNEQDAQDALQEAYLQAFKAIDAFEGKSSVSTWLHAILVRCCLMRLRQKRTHPEAAIEDLLPAFKDDGHRRDVGPRWRSTPEDAISAEDRTLVRACIDKLPEDFRNVLLLRDIQEMSTQEAAAVLDVTEGVVKTRLHRARQALRTLLDPYFRSR